MPELVSKKEFNRLMKTKGIVRGQAPRNVGEFILEREGENGLKKLEGLIAKLGYPIKYKEVKVLGFYPLGFLLVTYLITQKLFDYDEKKFREIGTFQAHSSFIISLFTRYLFSLDKAILAAPKMWRKYFSNGELKVVELDEEKKKLVLRIDNFQTHPLHCQALSGYFSTIVDLLVSGNTRCNEVKCTSKKDKYHEFIIEW